MSKAYLSDEDVARIRRVHPAAPVKPPARWILAYANKNGVIPFRLFELPGEPNKRVTEVCEATPASLRGHARHYIYVLCLVATGQPVYVGSSWNPWDRNWQRFHRPRFRSDKFFASQGESSFQLLIIDWVEPHDAASGWYGDAYDRSHRLENFWMKKLKTRTKDDLGGKNEGPAGIPFS
jgi:hypothetical protein